MNAARPRYAVITPARDEAANLMHLAASLASQLVLPEEWIIIDNGSTDDTAAVAAALSDRYEWVRWTSIAGEEGHVRGAPVVRAFHVGITQVRPTAEFVAKVDADVTFEEDYFVRLLSRFAEDPSLGIASGGCYELVHSHWRQRHTTEPNVWGAARIYRRSCLDAILPLADRMGWDVIDVLRARVANWRTHTCDEIPFRHHRVEAQRDGARHLHWLRQGEVAHYLHYRPTYLLLRTLHRVRRDRTAPALLWGFAVAAVQRRQRCEEPSVVAHVREQQRLRHIRRRAIEAARGSESSRRAAAARG